MAVLWHKKGACGSREDLTKLNTCHITWLYMYIYILYIWGCDRARLAHDILYIEILQRSADRLDRQNT